MTNTQEAVEQQQVTRANGNVPITLACALYDRMQALHTGTVKPEGIDLNFVVEDFPRKLFDQAMSTQAFDVCEMSSCDYITRVSSGESPFVALPVFPSKCFRHGMITINKRSNIRTPKDLEGKRVGVMRFTMSAAIWQRGHLQNDYGVDLKSISWVEGSVNSPGSHGVPTVIPPGYNVTVNQTGKSLSQLLDEGQIDAIIGTHMPDARRHNKDIVRLFPDFREVEKAYYKRTGIFPIMHLIAIKRDVYEANPFIAKSLYRAFCESKQAALVRMRNFSALRYMLPWMTDEIDELDEVFGDDPWTYGLEANRKTIETAMSFMVQQGIIPAPVPVEKLFVSVE
jgi:4,5-dihydroxyphthalate decarboxylase